MSTDSATHGAAGSDRGRSPRLSPQVAAWDLPTRLFHWTLLALLVWAYVSYRYAEALGDPLLKYHRWNGLAILVLLLWRLLWGVAGPGSTRFARFLAGPRAALAYLGSLFGGPRKVYLGHNPLGGWMIVALLGVLLVQGAAGLFTVEHNDLTAGPLYRFVDEDTQKLLSRWHRWTFYYVLLPLAAVHITANALYGFVKGEPLIRAMVTGKKPADAYADAARAEPLRRPLLVATVLLAISAAIVLGGIRLATGRLV